jgi:hypothetical protein
MVRQAQEAFYSPALSDDEVRAMSRSTAEQARANEAAMRSFPFDAELTEELIRMAPPGSSWNDEKRARWGELSMR